MIAEWILQLDLRYIDHASFADPKPYLRFFRQPLEPMTNRNDEAFRFLAYNFARKTAASGIAHRRAKQAEKWARFVVWLRNDLTTANVGIARKMAGMVRRYNDPRRRVPIEELEQIITVIMIDCVNRFDAGRGWKFSSYVYNGVFKTIGRRIESIVNRRERQWAADNGNGSLWDQEALPRDEPDERAQFVAEAMREIADPRAIAILRMRTMADEPATLDEIGKKLGLSKERVRQIQNKALQSLRWKLVIKHGLHYSGRYRT